MNYPSRDIVKQIKEEYPEGTKVELDCMDDPYAKDMTPGLKGTVVTVDDIGTIHILWDNGRTLGVAYGEDKCHKIQ